MYKIIKNNTVIDVQQTLSYVKYQLKNNLLLSCPQPQAQGILSSDNSVVWHLEGLPNFPVSGYDTVSAVEIDAEEYQALHQQLFGDGGGEQPPLEEGEEESVRPVPPSIELVEKVTALTDQISALQAQNNMLTDCLLEMSEVVYA